MREPAAKTIHLKDYAPPAFLVERVELDVDLREHDAIVCAKLAVRRNAAVARAPLALDGDELELISVALDGALLRQNQYGVTPERLTIAQVPDAFTLETVSRIAPQKNTKLEGLYAAKSGFVTQCEAEGFRRITWFVDRPDNMSRYRTTIHADKRRYPVLLSNGNL
ncbi:MAG: aminopeptidase N, partial [Burkholderiales bacterium]